MCLMVGLGCITVLLYLFWESTYWVLLCLNRFVFLLTKLYNGSSLPTFYSAFLVICFLYKRHGKYSEMESQNSVFLYFWEIILLHHFHLPLYSSNPPICPPLLSLKCTLFINCCIACVCVFVCVCKIKYIPKITCSVYIMQW